MLLSWLVRAAPAALLLVGVNASPVADHRKRASLDDFIKTQTEISLKGVLANIGPDGSKAGGVPAGIVVASPSRSNPDYWYTWTRDAALTYKALVERLIAGDTSLKQKIDDYVTAQAYLQGVSNPSGGPDTGGLGEPKFNVDRTAFTGAWGRPQRDGPALRATALTIYANWLIQNGGATQAKNTVWPVIAKDLAYVVKYWNQTGFDLWEEVNGSSYFTIAASHRALVEGVALATKLGQQCTGCAEAAPQVLCFAQSFWTGSYIDSNINVNDGRTGKDVNSIISSIHTFDPNANCTDATFQPCSARALANHKAVADSFRSIYGVNKGIAQGRAVGIGRYSEDVYYNGNPWYLATLAAAEQLYSAIYQWDKQGSITVNSVSLPFFRDILPSISVGTYQKGSSTYASILSAVKTYGDDFIAVVQKYTPANGALAEQFDRNNGSPLSAADLTWSYAAFLTATERRAGVVSPTWDEPSNNVPPKACTGTPACNTKTTFNVRATTTFGENIYVTGQLTQLGNWSPADAKPLSASKYTNSDPLWFAEIELPAGTVFEYKYIRKTANGQVVWESDPNRRFTTAVGCGSTATVNDTWR
ncbi:glucoamylase/glucan 1,4-alpha-glucosidase-like protein [Westerdykella ornata]|uniref:Glucoamylase n=1 Tax=Westerdykella ornata TaxID=318751 RepID=A0A6A6JIJ8_WESOR|nr:glucoamylase/glucan 1,4-alpha-glucosidase-like protein [Westerdykella ornata]KAF2276391.1 glucoamylase/glucan 1,4-alpha-glucosidase-like protein [Westerdykella ornata]